MVAMSITNNGKTRDLNDQEIAHIEVAIHHYLEIQKAACAKSIALGLNLPPERFGIPEIQKLYDHLSEEAEL